MKSFLIAHYRPYNSKISHCFTVYLQGISQSLAGTDLSGRCNDMGCIFPERAPWCPCSNLEHIPEETEKDGDLKNSLIHSGRETNLVSMTEFPQGCSDGEEIKSKNKDFSVQFLPAPRQYKITGQTEGPILPRYHMHLILVCNS